MKRWICLHTQLRETLSAGGVQENTTAYLSLLLKLEVLLIEAECNYQTGEDQVVEPCLRELESRMPSGVAAQRELRVLSRSARWAERRGIQDLATDLYLKTIVLAQQIGNHEIQIQNMEELGEIHRKAGRFIEAEDCQQKAAELSIETALYNMHAHALNNLAVIAIETGDLQKAQILLSESLESLEKVPEPQLTGHIYNNLGVIDCIKGQPDHAFSSLNRALIFRSQARDRKGFAETNHNLGMAAMDANHLDMSEEYLNRALRIAEDLGDKYTQANVVLSKAELFAIRNDPVIAGKLAMEARSIHLQLDDPLGAADGLRIFGESELSLLRYDSAERSLETALKQYQEYNHIHGQAQCCESLCYLNTKTDQVLLVRQWAKKAIDLWDQLSNTAAVDRLKSFL